MSEQILFICQWKKGCKARDYCNHASDHIEMVYKTGIFKMEKCTEEHQCPFQEVPVRCRKVWRKK